MSFNMNARQRVHVYVCLKEHLQTLSRLIAIIEKKTTQVENCRLQKETSSRHTSCSKSEREDIWVGVKGLCQPIGKVSAMIVSTFSC